MAGGKQMSFLTGLPFLGDLIGKVADKISPDKGKVIEGQNRINEAEVAGAPASKLRLWRSFLGWVLALVFTWEVVIRPVILFFWEDANLPPSMLKEVMHILIGMLGLGF